MAAKPPAPKDPEAPDAEAPEAREGADGPAGERLPPRRDRLRGIARRLFREVEEGEEGDEAREPGDRDRAAPRSEARGEARELLAALFETGDKARMELVRLIAREVRGYLEAMELHKDLHHLLTNYSLEVKASVHLKPLADAVGPPAAPAGDAEPEPADG